MRVELSDKVLNLENELKGRIDESQKELKKKFVEQDEILKKSTLSIEQNQQDNIKAPIVETMLKINDVVAQ